ncbi:MAG: FAD-binding protein [Calditrichaeota bacterium]|nr:MAG: FAD-binding protein [Calditrichota bacterium]MBL1207113.1 FAD-binding protein [Calditrichota bacterium]NOG46943.1 FAD-binding protein [Calditrichota bacterium]
MEKSVLNKIEEIVGTKNFMDSEEDKLVYSYDGTPMISQKPEAIIIPDSVEQISSIMKLANKEKFSVVPRGSGTSLSGGSVATPNSIIMLMHKWDKIIEIDEENLVAWVQPGVKTHDFHKAVEQKGLFYPPDPGSQKICTIGGNVAENAGGLRGLKYGVTRDYVMAVEMVLPNGEVFINGGKNVKDVAGYNLRDLIVGSEGTLGIFTKILLKLIPKPKSSKTILAYFDSMSNAAKSVSDIIANHVIPCTMEFLDKTTIKCVEEFAQIGLPTNIDALLLLETDGHEAQVAEDADTITKILKQNSASEVKIAQNEAEADQLKTARRAAFSALARVKPTTILEDATVPRSNLVALIEKVNELAKKYDLLVGNFGHAGDGNMHPTVLTDERNTDEIERVEKFFDELYDETIKLGGTITGEHGIGLAKKKYLSKLIESPALKMMQQIKQAIDPNNVLNPEKIFSL